MGKKWIVIAIAVALLVLLAVTATWWLPPLLTFAGANADTIQGLTSLIQLLLWSAAGVALVFGWLRGRAPAAPVGSALAGAPQPPHQGNSTVTAADQATVATTGGVAAGQVAVGHDVQGDIILIADPEQLWQVIGRRRPPADLRQATEDYLAYVVDRYRYLDLRGMGVTDRVPLRLALVDLYVPLKARIELPEGETWARQLRVAGRTPGEEEIAATGQRLSEPVGALELLKTQDGLILLGDPGAGKTTFMKHLALHMALGRPDVLGMEPYIPFVLPLSAYANRLAQGDIPLDRYIVEYYAGLDDALAIGPILEEALQHGRALLLLDGLDEVKDDVQNAARRRTVVDQVVHFFSARRRQGNKFVLTSRIVGYREVRPAAEGLAEATLVDFDEEEIAAFVDKWTAAVELAARGRTPVAAQEAAQQRAALLSAVERNRGVRRLASNPLLLTILALMQRQGVSLPERRVELYRNYVDTLLKHWNLARGLGRPPTRDLDVVETLKVLAPLALWMHETRPGVGLVKQEAMRRQLAEIYAGRGAEQPERAAAQFLADVRDHAGLLVDRGSRQYGFIHLTFQEYLAAVAIAQQGQLDSQKVVDALGAHVGDDNWHEVSLLTVDYLGLVLQHEQVASAVVAGLATGAPGAPGAAVVLAGECVRDAWPGGVTVECRNDMRGKLLEVMRAGSDTSPAVCVEAGRVLGALGDPRVEVLDPLKIEWCDVPAGSFTMGEDELCTVELGYPFKIARYPITNAQYAVFMREGGYGRAAYWREAAAAGRWKDGMIEGRFDNEPRDRPVDFVEPFGLSNHPVVGVTWYEALAFTRWLTDHMQTHGCLVAGWGVMLPSEVEWEKAARGDDGREYPWGGELTPNYANYDRTGANTTSAVGCFAQGASPYQAEEMSGNVWEWTRSVWADYPYDASDGRERLDTGDDAARVLRGGSFFNYDLSVRCGARRRNNPYLRNLNIGFRVVLSPFTSGL